MCALSPLAHSMYQSGRGDECSKEVEASTLCLSAISVNCEWVSKFMLDRRMEERLCSILCTF